MDINTANVLLALIALLASFVIPPGCRAAANQITRVSRPGTRLGTLNGLSAEQGRLDGNKSPGGPDTPNMPVLSLRALGEGFPQVCPQVRRVLSVSLRTGCGLHP